MAESKTLCMSTKQAWPGQQQLTPQLVPRLWQVPNWDKNTCLLTTRLDKKRCHRSHWKIRCKGIQSLPRSGYLRHPLYDYLLSRYNFLKYSGTRSSLFSGMTGSFRTKDLPEQPEAYVLIQLNEVHIRVISANVLWTAIVESSLIKRN